MAQSIGADSPRLGRVLGARSTFRLVLMSNDQMMDQLDYYERRAEQELRLAQRATDARVTAAHYQLACRYLDLLHPETAGPMPSVN